METKKIIEELKKDYRTAEEWLLFYHERKAQFEEDSRYILDKSPAFKDTGRAGTRGNSWTEYKVVQLAALDDTEKWLTTVRMVEEGLLTESKQVFLKARRAAAQENKNLQAQGKKKVNWILFVQEDYAARMAKRKKKPEHKFHLSENTIKTWWKEIVNTTRVIALMRQCTL